MKRLGSIAGVLMLAGAVSSAFSQSGVTRVWAVDEGEKIKQDALNHWLSTSVENAVWDGSRIRVFGGRNEVVGFQVILEASGSGASGVNVVLDSLEGPGYVVKNTGGIGDPMGFVGKRIELFTEHYINVTERSSAWGYSPGWARPQPEAEHLGWLPDGLIPFEAPNKTPTTGVGGAPFAIGGGRLQGVWVDVYIPPDAPGGTYTGELQVTEQGVVRYRVPVELEVYGFTLPDTTHFHTMFYYEGLIDRHGVSEGTTEFWRLFRNYMHVFHRHRINLVKGADVTLPTFENHLGGYYTGSYYMPTYGYDGPGVGVGDLTYGIGVYDQPSRGWESGFWPNDSASWVAAADAWEGWFAANAPAVERFKYMTDEPDPPDYGTIIQRAGWIRNSRGPGRNLGIYATVRIDPRLYGAVTYWSLQDQSGYDPGDGYVVGYVEELVKPRQALGEKVGLYNGTRPGFGVPGFLDCHVVDNRVNPWIAFKYDVDQYFQWSMGYMVTLNPPKNVWVDNWWPMEGGRVWGDGQHIYPGQDVKFPGDSRGVEGPIVSVRLKNFRRGMQDYEYLWLARQSGVSEDSLQAIMNSVVPRALDEVNQASQPEFALRGYLYEQARRRLAHLLAMKGAAGEVRPRHAEVTNH
jgi:hypothetical protein